MVLGMAIGTASRPAMRALQLLGRRHLEVRDCESPDPPPGWVRCRVETAGVCGTDLHLWDGRDHLPVPHVLGHDFAARIDTCGDGVDEGALPIGARVTGDPNGGCGRCAACQAGSPHLCVEARYMGMGDPGCFQDLILLPAHRVHRLPDAVANDAAAVLEPVGVALHVADRVQAVGPDVETAVIVGCGPIGLVAGAVLARAGIRWLGVDPLPSRRSAASTWGAEAAFEGGDADTAELREALGPSPAAVVVCAAAGSIPEWSVAIAPPGSAIVVVGNAPTGYPAGRILQRELSVLGIRGGYRYPDAIALAATGELSLGALVTERCPLEQAAPAFARLHHEPGATLRLHLDVDGAGS